MPSKNRSSSKNESATAAAAALPVELSRDAVVINEGTRYDVPVLPESSHQLNRTVEVRTGAVLKGPIFGLKVNLAAETIVENWVFGEQLVKLEESARVEGSLVSKGLVELGSACEVGSGDFAGNIIAPQVKIGNGCKIRGNIIARDALWIEGECTIDGFVCCTGKEVKLGQGNVFFDLISLGAIKLGGALELKDSVLWAGGAITCEASEKVGLLSNLIIGGENPRSTDLLSKGPSVQEVNVNYDKVSFVEPKTLRVKKDQVLKQIEQILG